MKQINVPFTLNLFNFSKVTIFHYWQAAKYYHVCQPDKYCNWHSCSRKAVLAGY